MIYLNFRFFYPLLLRTLAAATKSKEKTNLQDPPPAEPASPKLNPQAAAFVPASVGREESEESEEGKDSEEAAEEEEEAEVEYPWEVESTSSEASFTVQRKSKGGGGRRRSAAPKPSEKRHRGRVVRVVHHKQYGFIRPEGGARATAKKGRGDVFFHFEDVLGGGRGAQKGDLVSYELVKVPGKSDKAVNVAVNEVEEEEKVVEKNPDSKRVQEEVRRPPPPPAAAVATTVIEPEEKEEKEEKKEESPPPPPEAAPPPRASWESTFVPPLLKLLKEFDARESERAFDRTPFDCLVCFEEKMGRECIKFTGEKRIEIITYMVHQPQPYFREHFESEIFRMLVVFFI